jgi:hypothetical protein
LTNLFDTAYAYRMASFQRRLVPFAAACAIVTAAGQARADHELELFLLVGGTPMAHSTLLPGYISTVMYGLNTHERMPIPWTVMNSITGAMGASFGVLQLAVGVAESTGSSDKKQLRPFNIAAGASAIAGSAVVITATILQTARPKTQEQARPILVIPMPITTRAGTTAGLMAVGCF